MFEQLLLKKNYKVKRGDDVKSFLECLKQVKHLLDKCFRGRDKKADSTDTRFDTQIHRAAVQMEPRIHRPPNPGRNIVKRSVERA